MLKPSRLDRVRNLVLMLLVAGLIAALVLEAQSGAALRARLLHNLHASASPPALSIAQPFALRSPEAYAPITRHPLFTASREPSEAPQISPQVAQDLELKGVAISANTAVALVENTQTGKMERLVQGANSSGSGTQIEQVQPDSVVVKQGATTTKLELHVALSPTEKALEAAALPKKTSGAVPLPKQQASKPVVGMPGTTAPTTEPVYPALSAAQIDAMRAKLGLPPRKPLFPN